MMVLRCVSEFLHSLPPSKRVNERCMIGCVQLFATPWTIAHQASLSMGFSRQEHWSGLPLASPGDLPDSEIEPGSPALAGIFFFFLPPLNHVGRPVLSPNNDTIILLSLLTNRMWHRVMLITPESRSQHGSLLCGSFSPGSLVVGGGKSHAVRSSSSLWRGPCVEELEPPANSQHHRASHRRQPPWRQICQPQSSLHFDSHLLKGLETKIPS